MSCQTKTNVARTQFNAFNTTIFVAEQFTSIPGQYVSISETVRVKEILEGKHIVC